MRSYALRVDDVVRVALVVAVVLSGAGMVAGVASDDSTDGLGAETFAQSEIDPDTTTLGITLAENGSATWEVSYRVELATENDTAAFESLQDDIDADTESYLSSFRDRMERTAGTAENATGRSMAIRGLSVSTNVEEVQQYGTVTYRFQWTNFAPVDGETIRMGDSLAGFFLEDDSRLTVTWPEGYDATTVSPEPDDRRDLTAAWEGPIEFGSNGPQVTAGPASTGGSLPTTLLLLTAFLAVGVVAAVWLAFKRGLFDIGGSDPDGAPASGGEAAGAAGGGVAGGGDTPAGAAGGKSTAQASADEQSAVDEELLSNEERVLRLLDDRGGRIKQQEVAGEFDWTDAKTSQVVKTLRENDEIDVFRLGRENVLVDPDESEL